MFSLKFYITLPLHTRFGFGRTVETTLAQNAKPSSGLRALPTKRYAFHSFKLPSAPYKIPKLWCFVGF